MRSYLIRYTIPSAFPQYDGTGFTEEVSYSDGISAIRHAAKRSQEINALTYIIYEKIVECACIPVKLNKSA